MRAPSPTMSGKETRKKTQHKPTQKDAPISPSLEQPGVGKVLSSGKKRPDTVIVWQRCLHEKD